MGLLRGVARTAVVAGTATAVSNRVSRRQAGRWAAQEEEQAAPPPQDYPPQQAYAAPAPPAASDPDADLARLGSRRGTPRADLLRDVTDAALLPRYRNVVTEHLGDRIRAHGYDLGRLDEAAPWAPVPDRCTCAPGG